MTDKKHIHLPHYINPVQIARLLKRSKNLKVSEKTRQKMTSVLMDHLSASIDKELAVKESDLPVTRRGVTPVVTPQDIDTAANTKRSLREYVEANASWDVMSGSAMQWFAEQNYSAESAARVIELAFLHGDLKTAARIFDEVLSHNKDFYFHIYEDVRIHLLVAKWNLKDINAISHMIFRLQHKHSLVGLENLLILCGYINSNKYAEVLSYYQTFEKKIWDAVREYGEKIKVTTANLALQIAKIAFEEGNDRIGVNCLQRISPRDDVYVSACRLMERARLGWSKDKTVSDARQQLAQADWAERLQLMDQHLARALAGEPLVGVKQTIIDYINTPFKWLPQTESAYRQFSILLVKYYNLVEEFPSLIGLLSTQCTEFMKPALDQAFWHAFLKVDPAHRTQDLNYWCGVALLHNFVNSAEIDKEEQLWQAHKAITTHKSTNKWLSFFPVWEDLYRVALQKVSKIVHVSELERRCLQSQLRVLAPGDKMCPEFAEDYLQRVRKPYAEALNHLQAYAEQTRQLKLAHSIELKRAIISYYRNDDLGRLWNLSNQTYQHDLSWRVATVLLSRKSLHDHIYHSWKISGENRYSYKALTLNSKSIGVCFDKYSRAERRFLEALLIIGGDLPELIHILEENSRVFKISVKAEDKISREARKILTKQKFYKFPKKSYSFNFEGQVFEGQSLPPFMKLLPQNIWSHIFFNIVNSLGCYSWQWQLSYLHERLQALMPNMRSKSIPRDSTKISRWLRSHTVTQRRAWQDISVLSGKIEQQRLEYLVGSFVARLTTLVMPHHTMALYSMQEMTNSLDLYRDLENWILSPEYSKFRQEVGIQNKVIVPNELKLTTAVKITD